MGFGGVGVPSHQNPFVGGGGVCCIWANDAVQNIFVTLSPDGTPLPDPDKQAILPWSERLAELVREAARLALPIAAEFDMVRVDFLVTQAGLLAGELTIYTAGGYEFWANPDIAAEIGAAWDLRDSWFLLRGHRGPIGVYARALIVAETARLGPPAHKASSI